MKEKPTLPEGWQWGKGGPRGRFQFRAQRGPTPHKGMGWWDPQTGEWETEAPDMERTPGAPWAPEVVERLVAWVPRKVEPGSSYGHFPTREDVTERGFDWDGGHHR